MAAAGSYVVKAGVVVVRDGERVRPEIGKSFKFTKEEVDHITNSNPLALGKPNDEAEEGTAAPASTSSKRSAGSSAEASQAAAKGGKKAATADKSDEEAADAAKSGDDDL